MRRCRHRSGPLSAATASLRPSPPRRLGVEQSDRAHPAKGDVLPLDVEVVRDIRRHRGRPQKFAARDVVAVDLPPGQHGGDARGERKRANGSRRKTADERARGRVSNLDRARGDWLSVPLFGGVDRRDRHPAGRLAQHDRRWRPGTRRLSPPIKENTPPPTTRNPLRSGSVALTSARPYEKPTPSRPRPRTYEPSLPSPCAAVATRRPLNGVTVPR